MATFAAGNESDSIKEVQGFATIASLAIIDVFHCMVFLDADLVRKLWKSTGLRHKKRGQIHANKSTKSL